MFCYEIIKKPGKMEKLEIILPSNIVIMKQLIIQAVVPLSLLSHCVIKPAKVLEDTVYIKKSV